MPNPDFQVALKDGKIAVSGRLDFTTASQALKAINEQMLANPTAPPATQVIDLGAVTHSNSAGLALMIEWLAEAQRIGRTIRLLRQISTVCQVDSLI